MLAGAPEPMILALRIAQIGTHRRCAIQTGKHEFGTGFRTSFFMDREPARGMIPNLVERNRRRV
jgi:hypothetical protein